MNAIEIVDVTKTYKGKKGVQVEALKKINFEVKAGEVFGFLGPNGAGKSTTIKTIMGLVKPSSGTASIFGIPVPCTASRLKVGYLPENPTFYDFLTAREYLKFVGDVFAMQPETIARETEKVLQLVDLTTAANRPIRSYSKGMVQRLGLAQTILHDPDLYVFDEPMSGLDPIGRALVKQIIKDLRQRGKTVFFSTHITSDIEVVCDRVGFIVKGQLRKVDTVNSLLDQGVIGYSIQLNTAAGDKQEIEVDRAGLESFLKNELSLGSFIERIEPKRKDLEAFFLDIVSQEENDQQQA